MSRSNSSSHHQRQYSDHLIDASSKWLQSSTSLSQVNAFSIFVLLIIIAESDYEVVLLYIYICAGFRVLWRWSSGVENEQEHCGPSDASGFEVHELEKEW